MKQLAIFVLASLLIVSCDPTSKTIDGKDVLVDEETEIYTFRETGEKVTGTVLFYEKDAEGNRFIERKRVVKGGLKVGIGYHYYPDGSIKAEAYYKDGKVDSLIKNYYPDGKISLIQRISGKLRDGISEFYREDGTKEGEALFSNDSLIRVYEFDEFGMKLIPAIEKLELVEYKTGFYNYTDLNSLSSIFQPIVIMKWKNISKEPLTESVTIEGVFLSEDEEWSTEFEYLQSSSDNPLQAGISRQIHVKSSTGFKSILGVKDANIRCQIYVNKQLYKTLKINNDYVHSNRM